MNRRTILKALCTFPFASFLPGRRADTARPVRCRVVPNTTGADILPTRLVRLDKLMYGFDPRAVK